MRKRYQTLERAQRFMRWEVIETIESSDSKHVQLREQHWIDTLKPVLNGRNEISKCK